jgi:hypothetical protein
MYAARSVARAANHSARSCLLSHPVSGNLRVLCDHSPVRLLCLTLILSASSVATAAELTEPRASGMELVAHIPLGVEAGDIWVHNHHAYIGGASCGDGVQIVNVDDPARPRLLEPLRSVENATYEDVVVIRAETEQFRGDLLAVGVQACAVGGPRGLQLWDVSDPAAPVELAFFETGQRSAVHELTMRQRADRVYVYLAVPFSERNGDGGDFRIVDATNPRKPVQILDWGVRSRVNLSDADLRILGRPSVYCHSVSVSDDGRYAYLSYWDAGYIILDISDPRNPEYLMRTSYSFDDEGNAHSTFVVSDRHLLLAADEDFLIGSVGLEVVEPASNAGNVAAADLPFAKASCGISRIQAEVVFAGQACGQLTGDVAGKLAAVDGGGGCSYYEKARAAERAGAAGVIIGRTAGAPLTGGPAPVNIPAVVVAPEVLTALRASGRLVQARLGPGIDDTWGYLRILDITDPVSPKQLATFGTENTRRCPAPDTGWYTIHNPVVVGDLAYMSWYSDGVRVVNIADPSKPREVAFFVPGGEPESDPKTMVWGVAVQDGYVYLSDMLNGLWIVKLTRSPGSAPQ